MPEPSSQITPETTPEATPVRSSKLMIRTIQGILWLLVVVSLLVVFMPDLGEKNQAEQNEIAEVKPLIIESETTQLVPRSVSEFSLTERSGKTVTNQTLLGKPWVVNFVFTSCAMTCPANTKAMMELSHACKDVDVRFVTITVDPERDTPKRLRQYAEIYQADPEQWLFLTGDKEEIFDLITYSFLQIVKERTGKDRLFGYEFAHTDRVIHIDKQGVIVGQYLSTDPKEMAILKRVLSGKMESPQENRFLVPEDPPGKNEGGEELPADHSEADVDNEKQSADLEKGNKTDDDRQAIPDWLNRLPAINAMLNGCATIFLIFGYVLIRSGKREAHKKMMLLAFATSIAFLTCYLTYHWGLHQYTGTSSRKFPEIGFLRQIYLSILISHIILAALVPFLSVFTIYLGLAGIWDKHRRLAQITFPIWLYVSITGVIIYVLLYHVAGV